MDRRAPLQVGQVEGVLAISAVDRPDQGEQRDVIDDLELATVAEHPPGRLEVAREQPDLSDEGIGHLSSSAGTRPGGRCTS
jgi:hypothetical protein